MAATFRIGFSVLVSLLTIGLLAGGAAGQATAASPLSGRTVTLIEPYGRDTPAAVAVEILRPALARELEAKVVVEELAGGTRGAAGGGAVERVAQAAPDGTTLVVVEPLSREIYEVETPGALPLESMTPIAKLTLGLSVALFVDQTSPIRSLEEFLAAAKARTLTVTHGWCVGMGFLRAFLGTNVNQSMMMEDRSSVVDAVHTGQADAGMFTTMALIPSPGVAPLPIRILATFGAKRHPLLPDVPTFAEVVHDPKASFTGSIAVFGPPALPAETAAALTNAFLKAGQDITVVDEAKSRGFPLEVLGADVVRGTIARDIRKVRRVEAFLKSP